MNDPRHARGAVLLVGATLLLCSTVAQAQLPRKASNAFNPAISLILDAKFAPFTDNPEGYAIPGFPLGGEAGIGETGLALDESELVISANIDDWFYGAMTAALHTEDGETAVELEEAYIETLALGRGATLKAGQFFSAIGYLNEQHPHSWHFADSALPYRALLGNQYGDPGLQLRWLAPLPLYTEFGAELFRGARFPAGGAANDGMGAGTAFVHVGGDLGTGHSWRAGLSGLWAEAEGRAGGGHGHGGTAAEAVFNGDVALYIADLVWKWAPLGNPVQRHFIFQAEYIQRREDGDIVIDEGTVVESSSYDGTQQGWYVQGIYQFMRGWRGGVRYGQLTADNDGADAAVLGEAGLHEEGHRPWRASAMLDYARSEFSRLRLQYNHDASALATDRQIILQYIVSLGAHGSHKF